MRHLTRLLLTFCSAAALLLCVAVFGLWVRSYWAQDEFVKVRPGRNVVLASSRGQIGLGIALWRQTRGGSYSMFSIYSPKDLAKQFGMRGSREFAGFMLTRTPPDKRLGMRHYNVILPHWFVAGAALVLPSLLWIRAWWVPRRRRVRGLCEKCGYDLRASPERCPECGAAGVKATS
jgi:hypothetical protein